MAAYQIADSITGRRSPPAQSRRLSLFFPPPLLAVKIKYEPNESDYEIDMVDCMHGPNVKDEDQKVYDKLYDIVFDHKILTEYKDKRK